MNVHYVLKLWEPAAPAFCSFSKVYVGDKQNLLRAAEVLAEESSDNPTARALREYFAGNRSAKHNIAYQKIPILTPVQVLASSNIHLPEQTWEHLNIWGFPYMMRFSSAEVSQIVIRYEGSYHRCVRARISDLGYEGIRGEWNEIGNAFLGNACILEAEHHPDGHTTFENILYVQEDEAADKASLIQRLNDPQSVILNRLCDEIFADG